MAASAAAGRRGTARSANRRAVGGRAKPRPARPRLLEAARRLVVSREYAQLRVGEIAAAADTSRQTFYNHFADKHECLAALCAQELDRLERSLPDPGSDPAVAIEALAGQLAESPELAQVAVAQLRWLPPEGAMDQEHASSRSFRNLLERLLLQSPPLKADKQRRGLAVDALAGAIEDAVAHRRLSGLEERVAGLYASVVAPLAEREPAPEQVPSGARARAGEQQGRNHGPRQS